MTIEGITAEIMQRLDREEVEIAQIEKKSPLPNLTSISDPKKQYEDYKLKMKKYRTEFRKKTKK